MEAEYLWNQFCEDNNIPKNFAEFVESKKMSIAQADMEWDKILQKYELQNECIHNDLKIINELDNGYFEVQCNICGYKFIDG